ncbi:MAG: GNAT family N-acetyltransferase [Acidimicrobiales bacterium]
MDVDIRPVTDEEFPAYYGCLGRAFGDVPTKEEVEDWRTMEELDRSLAVFDRSQIVGTAGAFSLGLTLPGGASLPVAGVTSVSVRSTHRRRGLLRAMMERQLDDVAARGEAVAILTASESVIYGRFGYGLATTEVSVAIDTRAAAFSRPIPDAGRIDLIDGDTALRELPAAHERARRLQPGDITRKDAWWRWFVKDPEHDRGGASAAFVAVHRATTGEVDGWVAYRFRRSSKDGVAERSIEVEDLAADDPVVEVSLWRYVLDVDLVSEVRARSRPRDEPMRWLLADPRRLRTTSVRDDVWVRLLDVCAALGARAYQVEGSVVLEITDTFRPQTAGRYRLDAGPDGAVCAPTRDSPDLALSVADLGTAYLGDARLRQLARAGRVDELRPGALRRADLMFGSDVVPFCRTDF